MLFRAYIPQRMAKEYNAYKTEKGRAFDYVMSRGKKAVYKKDKNGSEVESDPFFDYQLLDSVVVKEKERAERKRRRMGK